MIKTAQTNRTGYGVTMAVVTLIAVMSNPTGARSLPTPLNDETLDQIRAGTTAVDAAADAFASGVFSLTQTHTNASVKNYLHGFPYSIGYAAGGAFAFGQTAQTSAHSGGTTNSGLTFSAHLQSQSLNTFTSFSFSHHSTVVISF